MRREYEVFERFRDGSTLWRATVMGRFEAHRKAQELAEMCENQFFVMEIHDGAPLPPVHARLQTQVRRAATAG